MALPTAYHAVTRVRPRVVPRLFVAGRRRRRPRSRLLGVSLEAHRLEPRRGVCQQCLVPTHDRESAGRERRHIQIPVQPLRRLCLDAVSVVEFHQAIEQGCPQVPPKAAMTASPANFSTVPPCLSTSSVMVS